MSDPKAKAASRYCANSRFQLPHTCMHGKAHSGKAELLGGMIVNSEAL